MIQILRRQYNYVFDENNKLKPEMIVFYNLKKSEGHIFEQMAHFFTESRKSRRRPLLFFYDVLDQADINSVVFLSLLESKKKKLFVENS